MPDQYAAKPTNDQLLHDLARITEEPGSGLVLAAGSGLTGPVERILGAVEQYKATPDWNDQPLTPDWVDGLMQVEHGAWVALCDELSTLGVDINTQDVLCKKIEMWGEHLVNLRSNQTTAVRDDAFARRSAALDEALNPVQPNG